jgi:catechol 2,3-dioxygenase-like lactoylglutathione lyase family enzyme
MAEISHVGLTVKNLERSIAFYRDVIGLKEGERLELKSEVYRTYTKNPAAHIKFTYMAAGDFTLQLIEYVGGGGDTLDLSHNRVGCPHLAFRVPDAEAKYRQIQESGDGEVISEIVQLSPRSRNFYAKDPDGILIEFSQILQS